MWTSLCLLRPGWQIRKFTVILNLKPAISIITRLFANFVIPNGFKLALCHSDTSDLAVVGLAVQINCSCLIMGVRG